MIANRVQLAKRRYKGKWLNHFRDKTKKEVWAELTRNGETYRSLATFYKHTKDEGLDAYLLRYLRADHITDVFRILEVSDRGVFMKMAEAKRLSKQAARLYN